MKNNKVRKNSQGTNKRKKKKFSLDMNINIGRNPVEKILFTRTLSILLKSGINIAEALSLLEEQFTGGFKKIIKKVREEVVAGASLADTVAKYPKYFNEVFIGLVNVGEQSGTLADTLNKIAEQQEKDMDLARKIKTASLSPLLILSCLLILAGLLSYYILPQLVTVFSSFDMELPLTTQVLLWFSEFLRNNFILIVLGSFLGVIALHFIIKLKAVKPVWQAFLMSLPIIGKFIQKMNLARIGRILGVLLQSGISLKEALEITTISLSNEVYRKNLIIVKDQVIAGESLSDAIEELHRRKVFPRLVYQMISVGENTGTLESNLLYLAEFYEKDVDNMSKNLTTMIEPVMLMVVGVIVALIAISIISPIYEFTSTLSNSL